MEHQETPDEFALIAELFAPLAANAPAALGLSDDAALFAPTHGTELVLTADAIVEGVHFLADDPAASIARKLLRVNLSDLAAKGAVPRGYLLVASWRKETPMAWMRDFAAGLGMDQQEFGIELWGGDTVVTPGPLTFALTAIGEVPKGEMLRRSGAHSGDHIFVTGTLGDGALGLLAAKGELPELSSELKDQLIERYRLPRPRVSVGTSLRGIASAAMDISDGLMADLGHLCTASGIGACMEVGSLPLGNAASAALNAHPALLDHVLGGGDDYEILFAAPQEHTAHIARISSATGVAIHRIGLMEASGQGVRALDARGREISPKHMGYRHF
jgi:thiamine-monophosphate kinase